MNGFDVLVLAVVLISALLAFARGFVREALSMAALGVAILAVLWGFPVFRVPMREFIETGWVADAATIGGIFLLVYIAVRVLTGRIHEWVHDSEPLGILDRTAGLLFGVARGFLLLAVGLLVVTSVAPQSMLPKGVTGARFYPFVVITADALRHLAPKAGQAAGDMARNAAEAGKDLARKEAEKQVDRAMDDAVTRAGGGLLGPRRDEPPQSDGDSSMDAARWTREKAPAEDKAENRGEGR
jgi:membrane protein required for colicin V production